MPNPLTTSDEIYNATLQIIANSDVAPALWPLIMGHVSQRIEAFVIGELARDNESKQARIAELEKVDETEPTEGTDE